MYQFIDRPVTDLDSGSRFLVWSMRSWAATCSGKRCQAAAIGPAFARWRMIDGLQPFHRAMLVLNGYSLEGISFHPLRCNRVAEHEAILLELVGRLTRGEAIIARETLKLLVEEEWVGDCLAAFCALANAMERVSLAPGPPCPGVRPGRDRQS